MNTPFTCDCGIQTREPFKVGMRLMCAICAEREAPGLVYARAKTWMDREQRHRAASPTDPFPIALDRLKSW
jgi:hypothetical protein